MATGRELLDVAAEYARARDSVQLADAYGAKPADDLEEIAGRFDRLLRDYVTEAVRGPSSSAAETPAAP